MADIRNKIYSLTREQEERHTEELAKKLKLPYINLAGYPLTEDIIKFLPEDKAIRYKIIPYLKVGKNLKVGVVTPGDEATKTFIDQFSKSVGLDISTTVISNTSFLYGITFYESIRKKAQESKDQVIKDEKESFVDKIKDIKSASEVLKNASTTKLFDMIITGAINTNSSDVHIEPEEKDFVVRYRIDGILQDVVALPLKQYRQIISRIKYLANLRMDITDKPQDGRIVFKLSESNEVDLRVSLMPSTWGESVVLRLLGQEKSILKLDKLGFRQDALIAIREAISKPYGMILTSGPTGSGKTSTLYAIISELKKPGVKIITLENPVEYRMDGVEQSQVKPGAGYEFADGLKASLRQDPDILMVGEIRDSETAEIAVQAALTGHLLISTIHANSAPAVFARLLEIGVKPFLLSGSVNLIMAQRLVRKICPYCKKEYNPNPEIWNEVIQALDPIKDKLDAKVLDILNKKSPLPKGSGCEKCNKTGFLGRQVIIEVLPPSDEIESMIGRKAAISEFKKAAISQGMVTMEQDGLIKALLGITTIEEVWRVTRN